MHGQSYFESLKGRDCFLGQGVHGRIILTRTLKHRAWAVFILFKAGTRDEHLSTRQ
jgi:hypothetical protein